MVKFMTKLTCTVLVMSLCGSAVFAQRVTPNFKKDVSVIEKQTVRQNVQSSIQRGEVIFSEGFEETPNFELPAGWVRFTDWDPLDEYDAEDYGIWIVVHNDVNVGGSQPGNIPGVTGFIPAHSGEKQLILSWWSSGGNCWAITSGFELTAGTEYTVSFWLEMPGYPDWDEINEIKVTIGQTPTADDMEDATILYQVEEMIVDYTEIISTFTPTESGTYYLGFKDNTYDEVGEGYGIFFAIDDILITCEDCEGNISKNSSKISVYPNPAQNLVYIEGIDIMKVEIYNMFGQLVETQKVKTIDVSKYNAGAYLFKTYDVNGNVVISNIMVTR